MLHLTYSSPHRVVIWAPQWKPPLACRTVDVTGATNVFALRSPRTAMQFPGLAKLGPSAPIRGAMRDACFPRRIGGIGTAAPQFSGGYDWRAFHWMDRHEALGRFESLLQLDGAVLLFGDERPKVPETPGSGAMRLCWSNTRPATRIGAGGTPMPYPARFRAPQLRFQLSGADQCHRQTRFEPSGTHRASSIAVQHLARSARVRRPGGGALVQARGWSSNDLFARC